MTSPEYEDESYSTAQPAGPEVNQKAQPTELVKVKKQNEVKLTEGSKEVEVEPVLFDNPD